MIFSSCEFGAYLAPQTICDATCHTELVCVSYTTFGFLAETVGIGLLILVLLGGFCALGKCADTMAMIPKNEQPPYSDIFAALCCLVWTWVLLNFYWWFRLV